jgi:hypothetical protein
MNKAKGKKKSGKVGQRKTKTAKPGSKKRTSRKPMDPVKVREEIRSVVAAASRKIAEAVTGECMKGQLAPTKYLWEMTGVFPVAENTSEEEKPKEEEQYGESLMRMLIEGLQPPAKTEDSDSDDEDEDESGEDKSTVIPEEKKPGEEPVKQDPAAVLV